MYVSLTFISATLFFWEREVYPERQASRRVRLTGSRASFDGDMIVSRDDNLAPFLKFDTKTSAVFSSLIPDIKGQCYLFTRAGICHYIH